MDVLLDAGSGGAPEIPAEVVALRRVLGTQRVESARTEVLYLERLFVRQRAEVPDVALRRDEKMTGRVRKLVQEDAGKPAFVHEEARLGLAEDAAVALVGLLHVLEAPRRPQRFRHSVTTSA
jgi:hypothetical protein